MTDSRRIEIALLALRLGVFVVLAMWVADKFINPAHGSAVFAGFYGVAGVGTGVVQGLGVLQGLVVLAFVLGLVRTWSYAAVLMMHAASTLLTFPRYLEPWQGANLLFFAAWPMLAACLALFLLRDRDRLFSLAR